jgi:hypothetical protein
VLSSRYINKILTLVYYEYKDSVNKNIMVLLGAASEYELIDVQTELYFIKNDYAKCIEIYKYAANEYYKNLIFEFLENALKKLTTEGRKSDKQKLTKSIAKYIEWMVELNPQNTIWIIQNFLPDLQNNLI